MNRQQHMNSINFWRGSQNYSNLTAKRETLTLANQTGGQPSSEPAPIISSSTNQTSAQLQEERFNEPLGNPPMQENVETMPSTDVGGNNGGGQGVNIGSGGGYGGGGGGFPAQEEEMIEEEIKLPSNKILGLKPAYFYGGLLATAVLGYLLFGRKAKTTKTIK